MTFFATSKKQSLKTWLYKLGFNLFPALRGTGGRVTFISSDFKELHVKLPLSWRTRNYVGTIFGGSMYAASDPMYMLQLIQILGDDYVVWDKAAKIRFKKPGKSTLYIKFEITDDIIIKIKRELENEGKMDLILHTHWLDKNNVVHCELEKTLYIATKEYYNKRKK